MGSEDSVTRWIKALKEGDREAARRLWERYCERLVTLARGRLRDVRRGAADEEDVALEAFDSFHRGVKAGRFPRLDDRHDLWRLLVAITVRKALDLRSAEDRIRRGGGRRRNFSELTPDELTAVCVSGPSPELVAQFADETRRMMGELGDATLRSVAVWKLEGYTNAEVAARLGCSIPTVERKLRRIRVIWEEA
jgi:DNA-directed RNA polymerase specialized sigma24 family protein